MPNPLRCTSRDSFVIGISSETKNGLPHRPSAPQKRSQKLKDQKDPDQVDNEYTNQAIGAELFSDPAARRRNELRPCDRNIYKRDRSDEHTRLTDCADRLVCTFRGQTNRIFLSCAFRSGQTDRIILG